MRVAVVTKRKSQWLPQSLFNANFGRPFEAQRKQKGCRSIAQIEGLSIAAEHIYYVVTFGQPLCIHSAITTMHLPPLCLIWVNFDNQPPLQPLCDCFEHVQNLMMTMVSMVMSEHSVNHLWMTKAKWPPSHHWPAAISDPLHITVLQLWVTPFTSLSCSYKWPPSHRWPAAISDPLHITDLQL